MATFETADYAIDPTTDGFRARAVKHSVEGGAADGDFGLLTSQRPCPQTATDDGLVSPYRRLGQPTLSVAAGTLPFHLAASADSSDMPGYAGPFVRHVRRRLVDHVGARRNDDGRRPAIIDNCVVCRFSVIGTVEQ